MLLLYHSVLSAVCQCCPRQRKHFVKERGNSIIEGLLRQANNTDTCLSSNQSWLNHRSCSAAIPELLWCVQHAGTEACASVVPCQGNNSAVEAERVLTCTTEDNMSRNLLCELPCLTLKYLSTFQSWSLSLPIQEAQV